jgi:hypothetical protein
MLAYPMWCILCATVFSNFSRSGLDQDREKSSDRFQAGRRSCWSGASSSGRRWCGCAHRRTDRRARCAAAFMSAFFHCSSGRRGAFGEIVGENEALELFVGKAVIKLRLALLQANVGLAGEEALPLARRDGLAAALLGRNRQHIFGFFRVEPDLNAIVRVPGRARNRKGGRSDEHESQQRAFENVHERETNPALEGTRCSRLRQRLRHAADGGLLPCFASGE